MHLHKWSKWTVRKALINRTYRGQAVSIVGEDQIRTCSKCGLSQTKDV